MDPSDWIENFRETPVSDTTRPKSTVCTSATATERVRPGMMLMYLRVRAAEATMDHGLTTVRQRAEDAAGRLSRLGATWVRSGEPHEDDNASTDPMARWRPPPIPGLPPPPPARRGVNVTLTASWDVTGRSAEEVLRLTDRLRFEVTADEPEDEATEDVPAWADPEEQVRQMMARSMEPPKEDVAPKFLFVARPGDDDLDRLTAGAYAAARRSIDRLARAAGRRAGELVSISGSESSFDHLNIDRQRWKALLATGDYVPADNEVVSDDPRAAHLTISVIATFTLE